MNREKAPKWRKMKSVSLNCDRWLQVVIYTLVPAHTSYYSN